jgi:hypothetical protein
MLDYILSMCLVASSSTRDTSGCVSGGGLRHPLRPRALPYRHVLLVHPGDVLRPTGHIPGRAKVLLLHPTGWLLRRRHQRSATQLLWAEEVPLLWLAMLRMHWKRADSQSDKEDR